MLKFRSLINLLVRKFTMKCRLTPLVLAISLAFQSYAAQADVVDKQVLKAVGARVAIEAVDHAVGQLSQPTAPETTETKKKRQWKFWQSKKKQQSIGETSPVAHTVSELNSEQIQEKLNHLKLSSELSAEIDRKSSTHLSTVKQGKKKTTRSQTAQSSVNQIKQTDDDTLSGSLNTQDTAPKTRPQTTTKQTDNTDSNTLSGSLNTQDAAPKARPQTTTQNTDNTHPTNSDTLSGSLNTEPTAETEPAKKKKSWKFWKKDRERQTADELAETESEPELTPKYPIQVNTERAEITQLLEQHLPVISYQKREEMDDEQISYLIEDTPKDVQNLVRTEGYFNAKTRIAPQPDTKGYEVNVALGEQTVIDNVNVAIIGDVLQDDKLATYYKQAFTGWKLPVGATFRQEDWSASKVSVLSAVTRKKYPLARLAKTQATINPNTQKADLNVLVDSHQPIYFGEMEITGHQRYPQSVISGLADFKAGDDYDLDKLLDYQQALENDSHYSGASVQADFDAMVDNRVPVKVQVSEVKRQKVEAGLRFDSEYGLGGQLGYDHYNLFNRGYIGSISIEADKYQTITGIGISQPRDAKGRYFTSNLTYDRSTTQSLEKRAISTGIWHVQDKNDTEWRFGLEFLGEDTRVPDTNIELGRSFATMITAQWKKQNLETQMRPQNGYYADVKLGSTLGKLGSSAMMARGLAKGAYYFTPENTRLGTIVARGNIGYVYTNEDNANGMVPTSLMFRTGGASTVRGYELDSIGLNIPNSSTVLPDRAMAVASFEYQYPIQKKLAGQEFAVALFHDVGGVSRTFQNIQWKHGTGLGLRWFSPIAPFSFDFAYGHQDKKLRWHISLGTRF